MIDLRQGDCLDILKTLGPNSIDFILCDPPFGTTGASWDKALPFVELWPLLERVIKPGAAIALFGVEPFSTLLRHSNFKNYKYDWYWRKSNVAGFANAKKRPMKVLENICIFSYGTPVYNPQGLRPLRNARRKADRKRGEHAAIQGHGFQDVYLQTMTGYPNHLLEYKNERGLHPTQKPVPLLEYLINTYTQPGDMVLDFTMGSGSTGEACLNTGRGFIGIEKERRSFNVAQDRIFKKVMGL